LKQSIMGKGEILIYQSEDQSTQIEVRVADETIWLSQKQIAGLFGCSVDNVGWHLKNIYKEEELKEEATSEDSSEVQQEGNRLCTMWVLPLKISGKSGLPFPGSRLMLWR
jgi:hypothetical protein